MNFIINSFGISLLLISYLTMPDIVIFSSIHGLGVLPTFLVNLLKLRIALGFILLKSIMRVSSLLTPWCVFFLSLCSHSYFHCVFQVAQCNDEERETGREC